MAAKRATTRVLLVDDESLVRRILKQILACYQDMELVGEAAQWRRSCCRRGKTSTRHCADGYSHAGSRWNCSGPGD